LHRVKKCNGDVSPRTPLCEPLKYSRMRKIIGFTILGAVVLISAFLVRSKVDQARREASYRIAVASFQRDLHIGTDRADVQQYLHSRKVDYHVVRYGGNDADTYEIKIGEEPANSLVCEDWDVYVALEFTASDKLREIHVRKIGTCL
jgi:hypothetical protein